MTKVEMTLKLNIPESTLRFLERKLYAEIRKAVEAARRQRRHRFASL